MIARNFDLLIYRIRMVTKYIMVWIVATFTKSPPQFSVYVYSIDPWEAARMVVYINVFTLGSIHFKTESVGIDTKQQMTQSWSCSTTVTKRSPCVSTISNSSINLNIQ